MRGEKTSVQSTILYYGPVALSNWRQTLLAHPATNRIGWNFDCIVPVEEVGTFKPHLFTELIEVLL